MKSDITKKENIQLRITEQDKQRWSEAAQKRGMSLSEYIRYVVNVAYERSEKE